TWVGLHLALACRPGPRGGRRRGPPTRRCSFPRTAPLCQFGGCGCYCHTPDHGWADGQKNYIAGPADRRGSDRDIALVALSVAGGLGIGLGYAPMSLSYSL